MATPPNKDSEVEKYRLAIALILSVFGLTLAALVVLILALAKFSGSDITAIIGSFTTLLGTSMTTTHCILPKIRRNSKFADIVLC